MQSKMQVFMNSLGRFASTAPVISTAWLTVTAFLLIEINHYYPNLLTFSQIRFL